MDTIKIKCKGHIDVPLEQFKDLQGNLKSLSKLNLEKLKKSILEKGFLFPFFAWQNKNSYFIIDAHQRYKILNLLKEEGYLIPNLPTVLIECLNKKEAKENLLLLNSRYGEIEQSGFDSFIHEINYEIDIQSLNPFISISNLNTYEIKIQNQDKEIEFLKTEIECPKCHYKW